MNFTIMIPTIGRLHRQQTLDSLPASLKDHAMLVVDPAEYEAHREAHGGVVRVCCCPVGGSGIGPVRQWCVENSPTKHVFLLDDDMVFFRRIIPGEAKLAPCTEADLHEMFEIMVDWLDNGFLLVGLSARQGNNHVTEDYVTATRQMNFHGVNTELFLGELLRFDGLRVMEDFHLILTMLTSGLPNRVMYDFCWNQLGSGAEGGCSLYRTGEVQATAAHELARQFPEYVKVVEKKSKTAWKDMETRTDVRIQWKKAYQYGTRRAVCNPN